MKIAIYARVSTEDQARHGLSIDTQLDNLRTWARQNGHSIVKEYVDAGVSGKKPVSKRPALSQFMTEIENGLSVDALVFTKLDRFFRSVKLYYQATAIMDAHKIGWQAIQEDYETITSAGRFKVNIMLSVAEAEADRTSERIKVVFERKIANGEYIGNRIPFGYSVAEKHLVPNEDAETVKAAFEVYRRTGSIYGVKEYLHDRGYTMVYVTVQRILRNPMYAGRYRDNARYCEPIIDPALFDEVQAMMDRRSFRHNQTKRVYLYSGLIRCAYCGKVLVGQWVETKTDQLRYRCNYHNLNGRCPNCKSIRESEIESYLLEHIASELRDFSIAMESGKPKKKGQGKAAIEKKIERLTELYVEGHIEKERFLADKEKLLAQIPKDAPQKDLSAARRVVFAEDFRERYNELERADKRSLWRALIDHITADDAGNYQIYFLP